MENVDLKRMIEMARILDCSVNFGGGAFVSVRHISGHLVVQNSAEKVLERLETDVKVMRNNLLLKIKKIEAVLPAHLLNAGRQE